MATGSKEGRSIHWLKLQEQLIARFIRCFLGDRGAEGGSGVKGRSFNLCLFIDSRYLHSEEKIKRLGEYLEPSNFVTVILTKHLHASHC
jgi:hypothetical protein